MNVSVPFAMIQSQDDRQTIHSLIFTPLFFFCAERDDPKRAVPFRFPEETKNPVPRAAGPGKVLLGRDQAFFAFLEKMVWKPSMTRMTARTTIARAKISWNQSPQAARPPLSFLKMVMIREHRVAHSMNTMGM